MESVIRRFKVYYDCLWKNLKRYMKEDLGIAEVSTLMKAGFIIKSSWD